MAALRTFFGADGRVSPPLIHGTPARAASRAGALALVVAPLFLSAMVLPGLFLPGTARAEVADAHGAATQWAQMILKEKGLYQGRPSSRLDEQTIAGLRQYQKNQGLPVTGRLDDATVGEMMKGRPVDKTVTNLADPQARARNAQPKLREEDAKPHAAQGTAGVQQAGPGQESTVLGFSRSGAPATSQAVPSVSVPPSVTAPSVSPGAVSPGSVSSGAVSPGAASRSGGAVSTEPPRPGHAAPSGGADDTADDAAASPRAADRAAVEAMAEPAADSPLPFDPAAAPSWVRFGLMGFVGLLFAFMAGMWWWSGRRPRRPKVAPGRAGRDPLRREPSLGRGALRTVDGRLEPHFEDQAPPASRQRGHR